MGCRVDRFHAGRCACIPQDVWSEADVTKTQRTLSVWFKTVRRSSFLFKACKRLHGNENNCKITNKNIHKKRNKQWKNDSVYVFAKTENNKPKQGRTEEKQLFLLEK